MKESYKIIIFLFLITTFLNSCISDDSNKKNKTVVKKDIKIILKEEIKKAEKIKGTIISKENEIWTEPLRMAYSEPYLVYYSRKGNKIIKIFNTEKGIITNEFCNIGKGPQELIMIGNIQASENNGINVFDISKKTIYKIDINNGQLTKLAFINENASQAFITKNEKNFIANGILHNGRFNLYKENKLLYSYKKFPNIGIEKNNDTIFMNLGYQNVSALSPNQTKMANIVFESEIIEAYNITNNKIINKWKHEWSMKPFKSKKIGSALMAIHSKKAFGFKSICVNDNFIYCVYTNKTMKELKPLTASGKHLIIFDWNGNISKIFELDYLIRTIAISNDGKKLFGTTTINDDIKIIQYDLY